MRYAVPLLGAAGAALYAVLRLAYVFFYLQLRATPEEVGYGYLEVLSSQLVGAVELILLTAGVFFLVGLAGHGLRGLVRRVARAGGNRRRPVRQTLLRLVARAGFAAVVVVLAGLPVLAWMEGTEAKHGYTVRNVYLLGTVRLPVLAVQAVPATVAWTTSTRPDGFDLGARRCLLYLGHAAGLTVFYDVASRESIRIPSSQIIVSLQNAEGVPVDC